MTDLRHLARRAESWQLNGDTPEGTSRDWESFQRAAPPDVVLGLLDERDRLREWVEEIVARFDVGWKRDREDHLTLPPEVIAELRAALQEVR